MEGMNDDTVERPEHHGAYGIRNNAQLKSLYVHRRGYVIFENREGAQLDFRVTAKNGQRWKLLDERTQKTALISWKSSKEVILQHNGIADTLLLKALPYRNVPLLQPSFHWVSDEFH